MHFYKLYLVYRDHFCIKTFLSEFFFLLKWENCFSFAIFHFLVCSFHRLCRFPTKSAYGWFPFLHWLGPPFIAIVLHSAIKNFFLIVWKSYRVWGIKVKNNFTMKQAKNWLLFSEVTGSRWQEVNNRLLFSITAIDDQGHSNIKAMIDIIKWRSVILFGANYHCLCSVKMIKK